MYVAKIFNPFLPQEDEKQALCKRLYLYILANPDFSDDRTATSEFAIRI